MKYRDGHVSNSSSSSFVLVTTKENYEATKAKCSKLAGICADALAQHKKLGKQEIVLLSAQAWDGMYFEDLDIEIPTVKVRGCDHKEVEGAEFCPKCGAKTWDEEEDDIYEAFEEFKDKVEENKDQVISDDLD